VSGYLLTVIGMILLGTILTAIIHEGKTAEIIKGIVKLVCVLAIISPVFRFLKSGDLNDLNDKNSQDFFNGQGIEANGEYIQYYCEMRVRQTESALEKELYEKFSLLSEILLAWSLQEDGEKQIHIDKISVKFLEERGEEVKKEVWEYLKNNYCSEVLIE
jgi:hypothetical protein